MGLDCMLQAYDCEHILEKDLEKAFIDQIDWNAKRGIPYMVQGSSTITKQVTTPIVPL